jgi:hypothetical protein
MEKTHFQQLIYKLLCKRKRRAKILLQWHRRQCTPGKTPFETLHSFFQIVLYGSIHVGLTHEALQLFPDAKQGMDIPYAWLTPQEQLQICKMFVHRSTLFTKHCFYDSGHCKMYGYKHNGPLYSLWSLEHRRELLRDFCFLVLSIPDKCVCTYYRVLLTQIVQHMMHTPPRGRTVDPFLASLHCVLQGKTPMQLLLAWETEPQTGILTETHYTSQNKNV